MPSVVRTQFRCLTSEGSRWPAGAGTEPGQPKVNPVAPAPVGLLTTQTQLTSRTPQRLAAARRRRQDHPDDIAQRVTVAARVQGNHQRHISGPGRPPVAVQV